MKKLILGVLFLGAVWRPAMADVFGDQVLLALTNHATLSQEYRHESKLFVMTDNVVEVGHLGSAYLFALDVGINGASIPATTDGIQYTTGARFNVSTVVRKYVPFNSEWDFIKHFEYFGRYAYDWQTHQWRGSLNVGYGFGAGVQ